MPLPSDIAMRQFSIGTAQFTAERLVPGLYITATPIGHLGDITLRALETLAACDTLLCEDTRTTARLLQRYGIKARLMAYHEHNAARVRPAILRDLLGGQAIALVSDAGMPLVSDPGYRLVTECVAAGIAVTTVPGASAVLSALALSGLPSDRFSFLGFLPAKSGERKALLREFAKSTSSIIVFESPHRIVDALQDIAEVLGERPLALGRELTKLHEEVLRGSAQEIIQTLAAKPAIKGEITLVIGPADQNVPPETQEIEAAITLALQNHSAAQAAAEVARRLGLPKKEIYARILARKHDGPPQTG